MSLATTAALARTTTLSHWVCKVRRDKTNWTIGTMIKETPLKLFMDNEDPQDPDEPLAGDGSDGKDQV